MTVNPSAAVKNPARKGPHDRTDRLATVTAEQLSFAPSFPAGVAPEVLDAVLDAAGLS